MTFLIDETKISYRRKAAQDSVLEKYKAASMILRIHNLVAASKAKDCILRSGINQSANPSSIPALKSYALALINNDE